MIRFLMVYAALLFSGAAAFGYTNVLENGTNITIFSGWDAEGDMIIGDATPGNTLNIVAEGSLTNVNAFVGVQSNAVDNTVSVSGTGAEWINTGTLQVGAAVNTNNVVSVYSGGTVSASNLVIHAGNDFNLGNSGTLALESGFDVSTEGFNWDENGHLSVGGDLAGMAVSNGAVYLDGGRDLTLNAGSWDTGTNDLVVGLGDSGSVLSVTNGGWVFVGAGIVSTNLGGGIIVASTNGASMVADNGAVVDVSGGFYIDGTNGFAMVTNDAVIKADRLDIAGVNGEFSLERDGTLQITGGFDADQAGFEWENGGTLTVNQKLSFTNGFSGTDKALNIDGGAWDRSGEDLQVDGTGNTLSILNGGGVTNNAGYVIGTSNQVVVSGSGSHWLNNGALNITNSGNSVTVDSGGRVTADTLNISDGNHFNLDDDGTLAMTGSFDVAAQTNLNWNYGGNLSVGGTLSGLTNLLGGRVLTLDGSSAAWDLAGTNIMIGGDGYFNTTLTATNGATVVADNLYVEGANNSAKVAADSWLLVGDAADKTDLPNGGAMVASTNGAVLSLDDYAIVDVEGTLKVGASATETGTVTVANNSTVRVGALDIFDANSAFNLEESGTLRVSGSFTNQNGFVWSDGSTLSVGGALVGYDSFGGTNRTLVLDGGTWDTTATNLYITGVGNTFYVTNGSTVVSASAYIGGSSNDVDNTVLVSGAGSEWDLAGNLFVNYSNTLELASNGLVSIAGNMTVSNAAVAGSGTVEFGAGANVLSIHGTNSQISADVLFDGGGGDDTLAISEYELVIEDSLTNRFAGFENLNMTNSLLAGHGTVAFNNVNLAGGWLAPDGEMVIDEAFSASDTILQLTAGADHLQFTNSGAVNLSGLLAEVTISNSATPAGFNEEILASADGFTADGFASTNIAEYYLLYDFMLTNDATTISVVSDAVQDGEIGATLTYAGIQGVRASFNGMQNALFVRTKQLRRNAVATDYAISNEAYIMSDTNAPAGPLGPGDKNTIFGMHLWAEQFSGQGDYDAMGQSEAFVLNNNGTTLGFDRLFGDSLVAGINYTYARTAARTDDRDQANTETYWLGLYGEWFGKNDYYLEGLVGLGWSDYDTVRLDDGYEGVGSFGGSDIGGHIEAGRYFHRNNWAMAPYAGLHYLGIKSDAYTEAQQGGGPPVTISEQSVASLESAIGVKLRNRFDTGIGRFQTVGYAEWVYDFINDDIGSTLSDGTISVETARITPGANLFNVGAGISWICTDYLDIGIGYDGRFNENYEEHMGSAMLDVRF